MKSANEVAENIRVTLKPLVDLGPSIIDFITKELTTYADSQRVNRWADSERLIAWINDPKRKPAVTAFTEGPDRQVAYAIETYADERVKEAIEDMSMKQALVHGESVMLNGKLVTNEELYKQPTDYIKETRSEALEEVIDVIGNWKVWTPDHIDGLIDAIRALKK